MRPHMAHIQNTMIKKKLAEKAKEPSYDQYRRMVDAAFAAGWDKERILMELEAEKQRIQEDKREGDPIFQQGLQNAKASCVASIEILISELKGE